MIICLVLDLERRNDITSSSWSNCRLEPQATDDNVTSFVSYKYKVTWLEDECYLLFERKWPILQTFNGVHCTILGDLATVI